MFRRRARADREFREVQRAGQALLLKFAQQPSPLDTNPTQTPAETGPDEAPVVPDLPPPDLRAPAHRDVEGFLMRWDPPLVIDGAVQACSTCSVYRDWIVLNLRDGSVWLRCAAGPQQREPRLDTDWYNRHAGPGGDWHPTLEDGLRHLGH